VHKTASALCENRAFDGSVFELKLTVRADAGALEESLVLLFDGEWQRNETLVPHLFEGKRGQTVHHDSRTSQHNYYFDSR
jgi:hypothetical protein